MHGKRGRKKKGRTYRIRGVSGRGYGALILPQVGPYEEPREGRAGGCRRAHHVAADNADKARVGPGSTWPSRLAPSVGGPTTTVGSYWSTSRALSLSLLLRRPRPRSPTDPSKLYYLR